MYAAAAGFFGLGHAAKLAANARFQAPNLGQMWSYFSAQSLLFRLSSLVIVLGFPALGVQVVRMFRSMLLQKVQLVHREFVLNAVLLACTLLASFNVIFHLWYDFGILPFAEADMAAFQEGKTSLQQSLTVVERTHQVRLGLTFPLTDDSQSSLEIKFPSIDVPSVQSLKIHMSVDNKTDKSSIPVTITYTLEGVNVDNAVDALRRLRPDKLSHEFIFPIPLKLLNDSGFRTNGNTLTLKDLELSLKDTDETARPVIVELRIINGAATPAAAHATEPPRRLSDSFYDLSIRPAVVLAGRSRVPARSNRIHKQGSPATSKVPG